MSNHSRFPGGFSPVQNVGGLWLKREDLWFRGEAHGSKCKIGFKLVESGTKAIIGGSHRTSPQAERIALLGAELGIPAHVHTAAAAQDSPVIKRCRDLGATIHEHRPGYMNVVLKRAQEQAENVEGSVLIPWGMECQTYVDEISKQVQNLPWNDPSFERVVVPLGSGMALSGILQGIKKYHIGFPCPPITAVSVGSETFGSRLDKYAPENWRDLVTVVKSKVPFDTMVNESIGPVALDPQYEAKCVEFMEPGDLLWVVAHRDHPRLRQ